MRKEAWEDLVKRGFHSLVPGRVGSNLAGGEDTELTIALRFCGWKLKIDPRLRIRHFMPRHRLEWSYLRRMARGNDASTVLLDGYSDHSLSLNPGLRCWMSEWWCYQLLHCARQLVSERRAVFAALFSSGENKDGVIRVERLFGRALGLFHFKGRYGASRRLVRQASWRNTNSAGRPLSAASDGAAVQF